MFHPGYDGQNPTMPRQPPGPMPPPPAGAMPPPPPPFPPAQRSSKVLWIVLGCIGAVLVLGIVAIVLGAAGVLSSEQSSVHSPATEAPLSSSAPTDDFTQQGQAGADALGEHYLQVLQQRDESAAGALYCTPTTIDYSQLPDDQTYDDISVEVLDDTSAEATLTGTTGGTRTTNLILFSYQDGTWCLAS